jgi:hypothetical protein
MDYWVPNGKDVVVAVIDSGVVANSSLQSAGSTTSRPARPRLSRAAIYISTDTVMDPTSRA